MKKLIVIIGITLAAVCVARELTYTVRIDDTSESGVTYIGRAASDLSATSTNTVTSLEEKAVWMITKVTSTNVLHSGGSALLYNATWANRLTEEYK